MDHRILTNQFDNDAPLPPIEDYLGMWLAHTRFIKQVWSRPSLFFRSSTDSIWAGIGLLSLGQVSQSYLLLTQAVEIALKGVLDEIQQCGIAAWAKRNPSLFRDVAARNGQFDPARFSQALKEKTLVGAFREAACILTFSQEVQCAFDRINRTRNDIAHRGGDPDSMHLYVRDILTAILPMLEELHEQALGVCVSDYLFSTVARELIVAGRFLSGRDWHAEDWQIALLPFKLAYAKRERLVDVARGLSHADDNSDDDTDYLPASNARPPQWMESFHILGPRTDYDIHTSCRICQERCFVEFQSAPSKSEGQLSFRVNAVACPHCHLGLTPAYSDLAQIHYGPISKNSLGMENWNVLLRKLHLVA